ncbi:pseudouridine synthase [Salinicoccus bachuensis]|uniref:Pseudouridine synthase n=1 Tax=Salinicoccus bachuensis TaxID=3136731 RepID=A0ABZ3CEX8_9STAP
MRLDKYLANAGIGSRSEVKNMIRKKRITVEGGIVTDPKSRVSPDDEILLDGGSVVLESEIHIMLNKPAGVISSTEKGPTPTVIDLIDHPQKDQLFPVGRLDKDTTGLLLITNDGKLAHELLSPRSKIGKTYVAELESEVTEGDISQLETGIPLKDFTTAPAIAKKLSSHEVELTITEGKFHQVKRMFHHLGNEVTALHRISFGDLMLDEHLAAGSYRRLRENEIKLIKKV